NVVRAEGNRTRYEHEHRAALDARYAAPANSAARALSPAADHGVPVSSSVPATHPRRRSGFQVGYRGDLDEELGLHQVGAYAVARRRLAREVLAIDLVHRLVIREVFQEDVVEGDVGHR